MKYLIVVLFINSHKKLGHTKYEISHMKYEISHTKYEMCFTYFVSRPSSFVLVPEILFLYF